VVGLVSDPIAAFWSWWSTARETIAGAIASGEFTEAIVNDIGAHVDAIGELGWELQPGRTAKHAFCLSPQGDPEMRIVSEMWRQRGPAADDTWEFHAAKPPIPPMQLTLYGVRLHVSELEVAFEVDTGVERVNAIYYHPGFAKLEDDDQRGEAIFLLLDQALGEDGVERWIGTIDVTSTRRDDLQSFDVFLATCDELARTATGERWAVAELEVDGVQSVITCNRAVKRIDHLLAQMHVVVSVAVGDAKDPAELAALRKLDDELRAALGSHAVYIGRETRATTRAMHFYAMDDGPARSIIDTFLAEQPRESSVSWEHDPQWTFVKELTA
jgi:hypothetical protein